MLELQTLPAPHAALLMAVLQELVLALGWFTAGALLRELRPALWHWMAFALLCALSFTAYVMASASPGNGLLLVGNVALVAGLAMHCRGLHLFVGLRPPDKVFVAGVVLALAAGLVWPDPPQAGARIAVVSLILAGLSGWLAWLAARYVRRLGASSWLIAMFALPMASGAMLLGARAAQALLQPGRMAAEAAAGTSIYMSAAVCWLLLSLSLEATMVGLVIFRLGSQLKDAATHDSLTGLINRAAMQALLLQETRRASRSGRPFSVIMFDIDHFKRINDQLGHAAGDHVLQELAHHVERRLRSTDSAARWGGEEFLVLLPDTDERMATAVAEQLREVVARAPIHWHDQPVALTVSAGVTAWAGSGDGPNTLVDRADEAMYAAKEAGRDRVRVGRFRAA